MDKFDIQSGERGGVYTLQGSAIIVGKMKAMTTTDGITTIAEVYDTEIGEAACRRSSGDNTALFENARTLYPAFEDELSEDIAKSEEQLLLNIGGMAFR